MGRVRAAKCAVPGAAWGQIATAQFTRVRSTSAYAVAYWGLTVLAGVLFVWCIVSNGIPALRHDWNWPATRESYARAVLDSISGWHPNGIGSPNPRPTTYLLAPLLLFADGVAGPMGALLALLMLSLVVAAAAIFTLSDQVHAPRLAAPLALLFFLFNPWTYVEAVAGHIAMILGLACCAWMLGLRDNGRADMRITLALLLSFAQIQYFIVCLALATVWCVRYRRYGPLALAFLAALPLIIGFLGDWHYLNTIPFYADWQRQQSISPTDAVQLSGYFAAYDRAIMAPARIAVFIFSAALLLAGVMRPRTTLPYVAIAALSIVAASGTRWVAALPYDLAIHHLKFIAIYRELYDILGLVAVAYVSGALVLCSCYRAALIPLGIAAASLAVAWGTLPPSRHWVNSAIVPTLHNVQVSAARSALMPPFQPLQFNGEGSGADPDIYRFALGSVVNDYLSEYPIDVGLARYEQRRDESMLRALSVETIITRPWLNEDTQALSAQRAVPQPALPAARRLSGSTSAPVMSLISLPAHSAIPQIGDNEVYVGDISGSDIVPLPRDVEDAAYRCADPRQGWVPSRRIEIEFPYTASPLEGVATSSTVPLQFETNGSYVLASWDGTLRLDGSQYSAPSRRASSSSMWLRLKNGHAHTVVCLGTCNLLRIAYRKPEAAKTRTRVLQRLPFRQWAPWLVTVEVPAGPPGAIAYVVRHERAWIAVQAGSILPHIRLDSSINGWLIPGRSSHKKTVLVELVAAAQGAAEAIVWAVLTILAVRVAADRLTRVRFAK